MTQQELKVKLNTLKQNQVIEINGFVIKKLGTQWILKKGDYFKKTYEFLEIDLLVKKVIDSEVVQTKGKTSRSVKKANALAVKLEKKAKKAQKTSNVKLKEVRKVKQEDQKVKQPVQKVKQPVQVAPDKKVKVVVQQIVKQPKPFKRNRVFAEIIDLQVQAVAYFVWFVYFFTEELTKLLGDNALYAVIGTGVLALFTHVIYARQLGKKHRIANIFVGLLYLTLAFGALVFYYGPITHRAIDIADILPSLELAIQEPQAVALIAFMFVKWILLFFVNKK
jgi:hypothetical protein